VSTKLSSVYLTHSFTCSENCNRTWSCGRSTILKYTDDNLVLAPLHVLTTVTEPSLVGDLPFEYGRSCTRPGSVTVVRTCKGASTKLSSVYLSMVDLPQDQVMLQLSEHVKE
jgi:hypothetical protein